MNPAPNLILVGPMGAGKTSIGRRLAERFGLVFVDADQAIVDDVGSSIPAIFENVGTVEEGMETIARPHGLVDRTDARPIQVTRGAISFRDVSFHYGRQGGIIEGLSKAGVPCFVSDVKGELVELLGDELEARGYDVLLLDTQHPRWGSRYNPEEHDYLNCPFSREEYFAFREALLAGQKVPARDFEKHVRPAPG